EVRIPLTIEEVRKSLVAVRAVMAHPSRPLSGAAFDAVIPGTTRRQPPAVAWFVSRRHLTGPLRALSSNTLDNVAHIADGRHGRELAVLPDPLRRAPQNVVGIVL